MGLWTTHPGATSDVQDKGSGDVLVTAVKDTTAPACAIKPGKCVQIAPSSFRGSFEEVGTTAATEQPAKQYAFACISDAAPCALWPAPQIMDLRTMAKPYDFDRFGFGRAGEYFAFFLMKTYGGKVNKAKTPWAFSFQAKTHDSGSQGQGAKVRGFYSKPWHF